MRLRHVVAMVLIWLGMGLVGANAQDELPESIGRGEIFEIDYQEAMMLIGSYGYRFSPDIPVRIGGAPSAVGLLTPGMRVQFRFLRFPDDQREVIEIRELPPGIEVNHP